MLRNGQTGICDPAQQLQLRLGHVQLAVNGQLICPLEHAMQDEPAEGRGQTRAQPVPFPSCTGPCPCVVVKGLAAHTASAAQKRSADGGSTTRVGFSAVCLFRLDLNSKKGSFSGTCPRAQSRAIALANHLPRPVLLVGGPGTVCFPPTHPGQTGICDPAQQLQLRLGHVQLAVAADSYVR